MLDFICYGNALDYYQKWPTPTVIISDGAYGINGFEGDAKTPAALREWYEPHVRLWAAGCSAQTTLWFWNTEIGWANVHPLLEEYGWRYRGCNIWNKGKGHIAGNVNTNTIRQFPVVTEVCVLYTREPQFMVNDVPFTVQEWLRQEWMRTGLPLNQANVAASVKNAATRKYLSQDACWYMPPADVFEKIVEYANRYGQADGRPYFSLDGVESLTGARFVQMRAKFKCPFGDTNVWDVAHLTSKERLRDSVGRIIHNNQKPLELMRKIIVATSDKGDIVWEPFGGLGTGTVASLELERIPCYAEIDRRFYDLAHNRFIDAGMLF